MFAVSSEVEIATRSAFILSLGDLIYNAVLALGFIVIARLLGAEGYGVYSLSISVPLVLYSFISLSLDTAITRYTKLYLAKNMYKSVADVVKASFFLKTLIGLIGTFICFFYAKPLSILIINRPELNNYVMIVSVVVLLESLNTYLLSIFVGFGEVWRNTVLRIVYSISRTTIAISLLLIGLQILGVLIAYVVGLTLSITVGFVFLIPLVRRRLKHRPTASNNNTGFLSIIKELIIFSIPLYLSSLIASISSIYQTMLLARALANIEIGGYRALTNLQTLILVVLGPITVALLPMYTEVSVRRSKEYLTKVLIKSNKYTAIIVVPLTLLAIIFSRDLIYLLFGADYVFASRYLPFLFASFLLVGLGSATIPQLFNALGMTKLNLYLSIISVAVFIPTSYILTIVLDLRLWGFLASGIITNTISVSIYNYLLIKILKNGINVKEIASVYISSALAIIPLFMFLYIPLPRPISLIRIALGGGLYVVLYLMFLAILRVVDEQEIEFLENAFRPIPVVNSIIRFLTKIIKNMLRKTLKP